MQESNNNDNQQQQPQQEEDNEKLTGAKGILHLLFVKKWHPQPTVNTTILIFGFVGVLFLVLGIIISIFNSSIIEIEKSNYQDESVCVPTESGNGDTVCKIKIKVEDKDMEPPVYIFYTLDNFYQNHRRYMKSKSTKQLSGSLLTNKADAKSDCDPIVKNKDLNLKELISIKGTPLDPDAIAQPCGLIAKSFFNDTYELYDDELMQNKINIKQDGISWKEDKGKKFKLPSNQEDQEKYWISPEDEHFIVWMRTSGLPNFRKLWGQIDTKLKKDQNYYLKVKNNYNVDTFGGSKGIVLSTSGLLGGKNTFLFVAFIVVAVICFIIALIFILKKSVTKNSFGEKKEN